MLHVPLRWIAALGLSTLVVATPLRAASLQYSLDLPADQTIQYRIELRIAHPGQVIVEAEWGGPRVLSLRLDHGDGDTAPVRRSGPSPLRLSLEVQPGDLTSAAPWSLWIRGLPARHPAAGSLKVLLPEVAEAIAAQPPPPTPEPEGPPPAPWRLPTQARPGAAEPQLRFHEAVEQFRISVVDERPKEPDDYRWQDEMLRFLAARRDGPTSATPSLSETTRSWLRRVESTARDIEQLRDSDDPILSGPVPSEPDRGRAWLVLHRQRVQPMERVLDALLHEFERGHTPELADQVWIPRFLSCLTVCQRHFDERARLGPDRATYGDVVRRQWAPLRAGAEALARLADVGTAGPE